MCLLGLGLLFHSSWHSHRGLCQGLGRLSCLSPGQQLCFQQESPLLLLPGGRTYSSSPTRSGLCEDKIGGWTHPCSGWAPRRRAGALDRSTSPHRLPGGRSLCPFGAQEARAVSLSTSRPSGLWAATAFPLRGPETPGKRKGKGGGRQRQRDEGRETWKTDRKELRAEDQQRGKCCQSWLSNKLEPAPQTCWSISRIDTKLNCIHN